MIACYIDLHKGGRSLDMACWMEEKKSILSTIMDDTKCYKFL